VWVRAFAFPLGASEGQFGCSNSSSDPESVVFAIDGAFNQLKCRPDCWVRGALQELITYYVLYEMIGHKEVAAGSHYREPLFVCSYMYIFGN
jgi:hypothetical protein